jgi:hypothetical protein
MVELRSGDDAGDRSVMETEVAAFPALLNVISVTHSDLIDLCAYVVLVTETLGAAGSQ